MTDEELRGKIKASQEGDEEARNLVIVASQSLVRTIVTRFAKQSGREDLIEDMCQEAIFGTKGTGGIVRAMALYRTGGKETFATYAAPYVLSVCQEMALPSTITMGQVRARERARKRAENGGFIRKSKVLTAIAEGNVTETSVAAIRARLPDDYKNRLNEDHDAILPELAPNNVEAEMTEMLHGNERKARFMAALDHLTLTERFVVTAIAGLNGEPVPVGKLANRMKVSRVTINRTLKRAIEKLKEDPLCRLS